MALRPLHVERGIKLAESQDEAKVNRENLLMVLNIGLVVLETHVELSEKNPNRFELGQCNSPVRFRKHHLVPEDHHFLCVDINCQQQTIFMYHSPRKRKTLLCHYLLIVVQVELLSVELCQDFNESWPVLNKPASVHIILDQFSQRLEVLDKSPPAFIII
jgi:hypothetical protein